MRHGVNARTFNDVYLSGKIKPHPTDGSLNQGCPDLHALHNGDVGWINYRMTLDLPTCFDVDLVNMPKFSPPPYPPLPPDPPPPPSPPPSTTTKWFVDEYWAAGIERPSLKCTQSGQISSFLPGFTCLLFRPTSPSVPPAARLI